MKKDPGPKDKKAAEKKESASFKKAEIKAGHDLPEKFGKKGKK